MGKSARNAAVILLAMSAVGLSVHLYDRLVEYLNSDEEKKKFPRIQRITDGARKHAGRLSDFVIAMKNDWTWPTLPKLQNGNGDDDAIIEMDNSDDSSLGILVSHTNYELFIYQSIYSSISSLFSLVVQSSH